MLCGFLALIILIILISLKLLRQSLRAKEVELEKFKKDYESKLVEYLYSGNEDGEEISDTQLSIIEKLKTCIQKRSKRKLITSLLYDLMNQVSGEMSKSIKTLYFKSGLISFALSKLKSKRWDVLAKGIVELRRFRVEEVHADISKFINHPRSEVRNEAKLYMVNLFLFDGLSFLDNLEIPLSEWSQIQLLETLHRFDNQQICDIKPWLKSSNNSVVMFALKLAQVYNQFEVKDVLMELLSHNDKKIRVKTIEVLSQLYGFEAKEMLKTNFNNLSLEEQISFFGLLEKLAATEDEPFIEKHLFHKNFEVQLLALKILKSINIDRFMGLRKLPINEMDSSMLKLINSL
jgi:hypothetical protein